MKQQFHYATISEAVEQLHQQGYTLDFNLKEDRLIADGQEYHAEDFEIADLYRYEGASDPADEATVYALVSVQAYGGYWFRVMVFPRTLRLKKRSNTYIINTSR